MWSDSSTYPVVLLCTTSKGAGSWFSIVTSRSISTPYSCILLMRSLLAVVQLMRDIRISRINCISSLYSVV